MAGAIKISILANARNAISGLNQTKTAADGLGRKVGGLGSILKGGLAVGGIAAVAGFMKDSFTGAIDAKKQTALLNSQLKLLGPTGKTAFAGAAGFADELSAAIGVDDDAIKPVLSKLASFPGAFKEGSLGAEGMERATKAAFDLQALGIGSAESNIIGIGKAMDNPVKGMAALGRSGVTFTAEQKKQIAEFVKQGKLGEAQKVLLKGIETNAKGAAEATATPMQKMSVAAGNVGEKVATKLLPLMDKLADLVSTHVLPAIDKIAAALGNKAIQVALGAIVAGMIALKVQTIATAVQTDLLRIKELALAVVQKGIMAATKIWNGIQILFNIIMSANPIGLIIAAIVILIGIIVLVATKTKFFQTIWDKIWGFLKLVGAWFAGPFADFFKDGFAAIVGFIAGIWRWIVDKFKAGIEGVKTIFRKIGDVIQILIAFRDKVVRWILDLVLTFAAKGRALIDGLRTAIRDKIVGLITVITSIKTKILAALSAAATWLTSIGGKVIGGLVSGVKGAFTFIKTAIGNIKGTVTGAISGAAKWLVDVGKDVMTGIVTGIGNGFQWVKDKLKGVGDLIPGWLKKILGIASPSKVMARIGEEITKGLAQGITQTKPLERAMSAVGDLVTAVPRPAGAQLAGSTFAGRAAGVGQVVINVMVPPTADPAEVGRQTVKALRAYEQSVGRSVLVSAA